MADLTDHEIAEAMQRYGGSFVSALGKLFRLADPENAARLKDAFPHYWAEYCEITQMHTRKPRGRWRLND